MRDDTDDIVRFINARVDEDERGAWAAGSGAWYREETTSAWVDGVEKTVIGPGNLAYTHKSFASHIARQDPARALRQCAALRRLLVRSETVVAMDQMIEGEWGPEATFGVDICRDIAAIWSSHPDYREEWKP